MKNMFATYLILSCFVVTAQVKDAKDDGRKIRIPVVFHVVYSKPIQNIPDSLIEKELGDLNLDFASKNDQSFIDPYFKHLVGNANIEFYLIDTMLQPIGLKGIRRLLKPSNWEQYLINEELCLNVFIANHGNASDILSDRVNVTFSDIGLHLHVLTHEVGHWLGLFHIWGQIGSCSKLKAVFGNHNDEIEDTPEQWTCTDLSYSKICPPEEEPTYKGHKTLYNNFMDYSGCRCMFSLKQVTKMRNNIIVHKAKVFDEK